MGRVAPACAALWLAAVALAAEVDPALPRYEPRAFDVPAQAVDVVGYNDMRDLLEALVPVFTAAHPGLRMKLDLPGTRFAPAALASGASAFAPMGAEFTPPQLAEYRAIVKADPIAFRVAHASLDPRALSGPLAVFVHRDNPLRSLTLDEASRVFSGEARSWGDLGLAGAWAARPIHPVGLGAGTALSYAFASAAMGSRGFASHLDGVPQSVEVVKKVGGDAGAIGFAAAMRETPEVRVLPIAMRAGDAPVALTEENIVAGRYPLDRFLLVYVRPPVSPLARDFLRLMLSREGQAAVAATPQKYLPLSATDAARETDRLELLR
jgi:phosphate transport system substrate-binding protein